MSRQPIELSLGYKSDDHVVRFYRNKKFELAVPKWRTLIAICIPIRQKIDV